MKRQIHWGALIILLAGAVGFGLAIWFRLSLQGGETALEKLIAQNAPNENVQALARLPGGQLAVGTTLGVITGTGKRWERLPLVEGDVKAIAAVTDGYFLLAVSGRPVVSYAVRREIAELGIAAELVAVAGEGRLVALTGGRTLHASADDGKTWTKLASFNEGEKIVSLAAAGQRLAVGGLHGAIFESTDGGTTWETRQAPGGSVTALLYDPSKGGRLWTAAGGGVLYSDDGGQSWRRPSKRSANQPVIALAPAPAGGQGVVGITPGGLVVTIGE